MLEKIIESLKKRPLLVAVTIGMFILVVLFHSVMTPFVIALVVVYLMEPFVNRMNKHGIGKRKIPRGLAVVITYLFFLAGLVGFCFAFIPSLASEISLATEELPKFITRVKDETIPEWSAKIDSALFTLSMRDKSDIAAAVKQSRTIVETSFDVVVADHNDNVLPSVDTSGAQPLLLIEQERKKIKDDEVTKRAKSSASDDALIRVKKVKDQDEYYITSGDRDLKFESDGKGSFTVRLKAVASNDNNVADFNLERELNRVILDLIESSTQYAGNALSFLQSVIEFVVNTFIQFILVFMLAAFISIDLSKMMVRLRRLFESSDGTTDTFDDLLSRLAKGLSGVIRGQLTICCINGTLTGLGLWILGVDFSLLLGIIAGVLSLVPIFGTILSTIPAVILGLVQGFSTALLVLVWILFVHFIDTNFFTPKIVGSSASLHPVVIIFSLLAGQSVFGALGLVFAMPVASIIQTLTLFTIERMRQRRDEEQTVAHAISIQSSIHRAVKRHELEV